MYMHNFIYIYTLRLHKYVYHIYSNSCIVIAIHSLTASFSPYRMKRRCLTKAWLSKHPLIQRAPTLVPSAASQPAEEGQPRAARDLPNETALLPPEGIGSDSAESPLELLASGDSDLVEASPPRPWRPNNELPSRSGLRTGGQAISCSLSRGSPFPCFERSHFEVVCGCYPSSWPSVLSPGVSPHAHDTRSISASWALLTGVSFEEIQQAAYWRSPNSFISFLFSGCPRR